MAASQKDISHDGRIVDLNPEFTTVEIISQAACASCHASALCGMSESKKKIVEVPTTLGDWYPGQEVKVLLKPSMGFKAVWIAYVIPLMILLSVLLSMIALGFSEPVSGLAGIAAVGIYYLVIWLFRDSLRKEYTFHIIAK